MDWELGSREAGPHYRAGEPPHIGSDRYRDQDIPVPTTMPDNLDHTKSISAYSKILEEHEPGYRKLGSDKPAIVLEVSGLIINAAKKTGAKLASKEHLLKVGSVLSCYHNWGLEYPNR